MGTPTAESNLAIDALDKAIVDLSVRINAATYELLVLIREFDERAGWLKWGLESCSQWLHWRCDLSQCTAREKVRVAHALKELAAISIAFCDGKLSYSKVRALTRVATPANEEALLGFALTTTAARVEERCQQMRNTLPGALETANAVHGRRELRAFRDAARGTMTLRVELPLEEGALLCEALDKAVEEAGEKGPEFEAESWGAQQADGLLALARSYLGGGREAAASTADAYQVVVHVDYTALQGGKGRSDLPAESVRRLACDGSVVPMVDGANGEPLSVGRKQRTVPAAMKRALWARDRGCSFPGCGHKRYVDAHHIRHWADGGETSIENTMLLCSAHHRLVHEGGYEIRRDHSGGWYFRRPDGRAIPRCGYQADDMLDDGIDYGLDDGMDDGMDDAWHETMRGASAEAAEILPGHFDPPGVREVAAAYITASQVS
jgi:hypothetical protein